MGIRKRHWSAVTSTEGRAAAATDVGIAACSCGRQACWDGPYSLRAHKEVMQSDADTAAESILDLWSLGNVQERTARRDSEVRRSLETQHKWVPHPRACCLVKYLLDCEGIWRRIRHQIS